MLEDNKKSISLEMMFGLSVKELAQIHKVKSKIKVSARLRSHLEFRVFI